MGVGESSPLATRSSAKKVGFPDAAASAPKLRPMDIDGRKGGHPTVTSPLPAFAAELEAEIHDIDRLPHLHSASEIKHMFPLIEAAADVENSLDWAPGCVDDVPHPGKDNTNHSAKLMENVRSQGRGPC